MGPKIRICKDATPRFLEIQEEEAFAVLLSVDDLKQNFAQRMEQLFYQVPVDQHMEVITEYGPDLEHFAYGWLLCTTGNLAMMAEYSNQVQFDEAFTGWGLEDNDFAFQWCLHGRETVCTLTAINYHQVHRRGPTECDELRRNMSRFNDKYRTAEGGRPHIPTDLLVLLTRYMMGDVSLLDLNAISLALSRAPHDKLPRTTSTSPVCARYTVDTRNLNRIRTDLDAVRRSLLGA